MGNKPQMNFRSLVKVITNIHMKLNRQAAKAVNISLTLRNWMIGMHIAEYELNGEDKSRYGEMLFPELAKQLTCEGVSNCNRRQLYRYRDFYSAYPQIVGTLSPQFKALLPMHHLEDEKVGTVSPQLAIPAERLINSLSFSHFEQLIARFLEEQIAKEVMDQQLCQGV